MRNVFVYGTLKRGHGNYGRLGNSRFIGEARTLPEYTMIHLGGFPGIVAGGETVISGELFEVNDSTLEGLDRLEGHPGFYRRTPVEVTMEDGTLVAAEMYVLPPSWAGDRPVISSGIWNKGGR